MREIELTKGQVALVDDADYELLSQFKWCARWSPNSHGYYAQRMSRVNEGPPYRRSVLMHSYLTGWPLVDHIDHNGLNNTRQNLRPASREENAQNRKPDRRGSSKYKGVYWREERSRWVVQIRANGVRRKGGLYTSEDDAARAYNELAKELHGEFAYLNVIPITKDET